MKYNSPDLKLSPILRDCGKREPIRRQFESILTDPHCKSDLSGFLSRRLAENDAALEEDDVIPEDGAIPEKNEALLEEERMAVVQPSQSGTKKLMVRIFCIGLSNR